MAEPFKLLLNAGVVRRAAGHLQRSWPAFDRERFERLVVDGLDALEPKARAMRIADALEATLPPRFADAAAVIEAALGAPLPVDGEAAAPSRDDGLSGWIVWPLGEVVARRGLDDTPRALQCLHALTQRSSAEWAIRPFIERHPKPVFATLRRWTRDPSAHVRRLVSEGSRPRLPWGMRLKSLIADPSPPRTALLRHASRSLLEQGHPDALAPWGIGQPLRGRVQLHVAPAAIGLGESITIAATIASTARRAQPRQVDYALHHVKANGRLTPKVFKGWRIERGAGESRTLAKRRALRPVTVRRYHAGRHVVDLVVNGQVLASAAFDLRL